MAATEIALGQRSTTKITKTVVDRLQPGDQVWDRDVRGFGVRRQTDRAHYFFAYRANGRRRWITLGEHGGELTADAARRQAEIVRGAILQGDDPARSRDTSRKAGTMAELARRYIDDFAAAHNKASTIAEYERLIRLHIVPGLGSLGVNDVTRADVARWHSCFKKNRVAGNRALALLKAIFNQAEKWGIRSLANPARSIDMFLEKARERLLSAEELGRLGGALDEATRKGSEHPSVITCARLLILTGARLSEILKLKWEHVDLERGVLRLPDSKTGAKMVPLGAPAMSVLASLPRDDRSPFVCPGDKPDSHFVGIQRPWRRIRKSAGLPDLRIHDMRHAFASVAAMAGDSLLLIGKVLGHKQTRTTERYAHLHDDPVRAVADKTSRRIADAMKGAANTSHVVPLTKLR